MKRTTSNTTHQTHTLRGNKVHRMYFAQFEYYTKCIHTYLKLYYGAEKVFRPRSCAAAIINTHLSSFEIASN